MNELYHHGIIGMKWGVRRYQNKDGSLTDKGERRYAKVASSAELQKKHTKKAVSHLKMAVKSQQHEAKRWNNEYNVASRQMKRDLKKLTKAERHGTKKTQKKYGDRLMRDAATISSAAKLKLINTELASMNAKHLSEIQSGTMKAGRDFIVAKVYKDDVKYKGIYNELIIKK